MLKVGNENGGLLYQANVISADSGVLALGVRVRPHHEGLIHPYELGLSKWA
jgi:hypothetical protein